MEESGLHSGGTTPSHFLWRSTPPRPAMLLWPERMKICLDGAVSVSALWFELAIPMARVWVEWERGVRGF